MTEAICGILTRWGDPCAKPKHGPAPNGRPNHISADALERRRKTSAEWSTTHPGYHKARRHADPMPYFLRDTKARAKASGVLFTLTLEDLPPIPDRCPALGIPLVRSKNGFAANSPSLDRTIPSLGYVAGNVKWISMRANRIKCDATLDELKRITDYLASVTVTR